MPPGAGYLHMVMWLYTHHRWLAPGLGRTLPYTDNRFVEEAHSTDFTNARLTVRLRGRVDLKGAQLLLLVHSENGGRNVNLVLHTQPFRITREWSEQSVTLVPEPDQWTCLGGRHDMLDTRVCADVDEVLADVNANIMFVLFPLEIVPLCGSGASSGKCCYNNCVQQPPNLLCQLDLLRFFCDQTCMKRSRGRSRCCPNPDCSLRGQAGKGNVIRHSFYITSQGRRRRYRCKKCGRTFSSTHGTPYYRLHKPRSLFDEVVRMCVHGVGISAVARIKRMAWGTVARWLESAAICAARFNDRMLKGFVIRELQADEIRTFVGAKKRVRWVLTTLEVWSRLWISFRIGTSQTSRECCSIPCGEAVLNTASCSPPMVSRCTSGRRKGCSLESVSMVK